MSAYIVDKVTIDLLVSAGIEFAHDQGIHWNGSSNPTLWEPRQVTRKTADEIGRMLWAENLASVAHRYPGDMSGSRPGPVGFADADVETYRWEPVRDVERGPLAVLSVLATYEYQSGENVMRWDHSEARRYCDALRKAAIQRIRGYADQFGAETNRDYFTGEGVL